MNFIRTESPWSVAAQSMQGAAEPLARLLTTLPQIRMQMQAHADEVGYQNAKLAQDQQQFDVTSRQRQQELDSHGMLYKAEATKADTETEKMRTLLQLAKDARATKVASGMVGYSGAPTMANAQMSDDAGTLGSLVAAAILGQSPAAQALASEQKPINVPMNTSLFSRTGTPLAVGMSSAPLGNTVRQPAGGTVPGPVVQTGQPRESLTPRNIPSELGHLAQIINTLAMTSPTGDLPEQGTNLLQVVSMLTDQLRGTNAPALPATPQSQGTNSPVKIKSIRQIQ